MENLTVALLITLIGMGLVFGVIVLFWLSMSVLVRTTAARKEPAAAEQEEPAIEERALRQRAAIVAVSAALAMQSQSTLRPYPLPATVLVNTWQAVMRARALSGRREGGQ